MLCVLVSGLIGPQFGFQFCLSGLLVYCVWGIICGFVSCSCWVSAMLMFVSYTRGDTTLGAARQRKRKWNTLIAEDLQVVVGDLSSTGCVEGKFSVLFWCKSV